MSNGEIIDEIVEAWKSCDPADQYQRAAVALRIVGEHAAAESPEGHRRLGWIDLATGEFTPYRRGRPPRDAIPIYTRGAPDDG